MTPTDLAAILPGVAGLIAALGAWRHAKGANRAVNQCDKDDPTLREMVVVLVERSESQGNQLGSLRRQLEAHQQFHLNQGNKP